MREKLAAVVPIRWEDEHLNPEPANQFVVQRTPADEIVITFGYTHAFVYGSEEDQEKQVDAFLKNGIITQGKARIVLTLRTAKELQTVLGAQIGDANT